MLVWDKDQHITVCINIALNVTLSVMEWLTLTVWCCQWPQPTSWTKQFLTTTLIIVNLRSPSINLYWIIINFIETSSSSSLSLASGSRTFLLLPDHCFDTTPDLKEKWRKVLAKSLLTFSSSGKRSLQTRTIFPKASPGSVAGSFSLVSLFAPDLALSIMKASEMYIQSQLKFNVKGRIKLLRVPLSQQHSSQHSQHAS